MKGIGVSPGIAIGKACVIKKYEPALTGVKLKSDEDKLAAIQRFDNAVAASIEDIETIKISLVEKHQDKELVMLETQVEFLSDPEIKEGVLEKINNENANVNDAVIEVIDAAIELFLNMNDEYMSARSGDVRDIGNRILKHLNNISINGWQKYTSDTIIIAEDIAPSDSITMDMEHVVAFATQVGGSTSHTAIIAKTRGIPAIVGCGIELTNVENDDLVIIDGTTGAVIINPNEETIDRYRIMQKEFLKQRSFLLSLKDIPATTKDGVAVQLFANITNAEDFVQVFEFGGTGVGLLRTELLFMDRNSFPDEEEQFSFYKQIAIKSKNIPVTVRTLDIGGDKQLSYFEMAHEENPFMGYRAIRICLDRKDIFITQLKAILRASVFGKLKIMFPMICNVEELRSAKAILAEVKAELAANNIAFDHGIETGIMIEIPSAAMMADILAKEVDFFSIGTNDLCQYTLAVDRMNEKIASLYDPFNPGVLRLINNIIEQAHKNNIHVGLCGEMASDPQAALLLLGMGLDEFSMAPSAIPQIKNIIIKNSSQKAREVFEAVMKMDNSPDIKKYLQKATV